MREWRGESWCVYCSWRKPLPLIIQKQRHHKRHLPATDKFQRNCTGGKETNGSAQKHTHIHTRTHTHTHTHAHTYTHAHTSRLNNSRPGKIIDALIFTHINKHHSRVTQEGDGHTELALLATTQITSLAVHFCNQANLLPGISRNLRIG